MTTPYRTPTPQPSGFIVVRDLLIAFVLLSLATTGKFWHWYTRRPPLRAQLEAEATRHMRAIHPGKRFSVACFASNNVFRCGPCYVTGEITVILHCWEGDGCRQ